MTREQHATANVSAWEAARPLALRMARRSRRGVWGSAVALCDEEELVAAGMAALAEAPPHDPGLGSVETWAHPYLTRGIVGHLRRVDALSRRGREQTAALAAASQRVEQRLGREGTDEEVAAEADVPAHRVALLRSFDALRSPDSLDAPAAEGSSAPLADYLADLAQPATDAAAERASDLVAVESALRGLDPRARRVVLDYYVGDRRLYEIAAELGVSSARVSQIKDGALAALRAVVSHALPDPC